jgi:hypothetical protein
LAFLNHVVIFANYLLHPIKDQGNTIKINENETKELNILQDQAFSAMHDVDRATVSEPKSSSSVRSTSHHHGSSIISKRFKHHENMWASIKNKMHDKEPNKGINLQNFIRAPRLRKREVKDD